MSRKSAVKANAEETSSDAVVVKPRAARARKQQQQPAATTKKEKAVYTAIPNEETCGDTATQEGQLCNSDDDNVILCLNIKPSSMETPAHDIPDAYNDISHESEGCIPYDPNKPLHADITDAMMMTTHDNNHASSVGISSSPSSNELKVIDLLKDFEQKNKNNEWPSTTSIHCYWCCHKFSNPPFGIPVKYMNDRFHVFGCFCSLECAASYNFDSKNISADEMWERYSLINMLSHKIMHVPVIKPAPSRLALKMFGGHLTIDQFREYFKTNKVININFPPMMTITQQIEEVNQSDITHDYKYIPIDTERINKYREKIRLKRSKPVSTFKNTLDMAMNLKIQTA